MLRLVDHFEVKERAKRLGVDHRRRREVLRQRDDRQKREERAERSDDVLDGIAGAVSVATEIEVAAFREKLDRYDAATVEALYENEAALDAIRAQIDDMLSRAHILPDGRRVFRTEDGTQVFDEHGQEVGPDELDPAEIRPDAPTWEAYSAAREEQARLEQERQDLFEFQQKLDDAREQLDEGPISEDDLAALDADLADAMPPAVSAHLPEGDRPALTLEANPLTEPSTISSTAPAIMQAMIPGAPTSP